jgi:PAS domain S-box-containing protein
VREAPASTSRVLSVLRNRNFWLVVAMLAICALLHYGSHLYLISLISGRLPLGLTRHAMERILFLLPITYAGFVFGPFRGFITLLVAASIMLPRAIITSTAPADALLETAAVLVTGGLVILWFESLEKEKALRAQAIAKLEVAEQGLQSQVEIIEQDKKRLGDLNAVCAILSQSLEMELVLDGALKKVLETMNLKAEGGIFLLDEETQELVLVAHHGLSPEFVRQEERISMGECLCGLVAQTGELLFSENCQNDVRHTRESRAGPHSHIIVPLKSKGRVLGVMFFYPDASYHPSTQDLQLLTAIGNQIGVATENARLYQQQRVIAEQLKVSEKNYRELFEDANDAIWTQDLDGEIVIANKASSKVVGYTQEELVGMNIRAFLSPEGLEIARQVGRKLLQGEVLKEPYELQLIRKDGTMRVMKLASSLVVRDGQVTGFQHIARDVTEEKKMQDNLRFYVQQITRAQEEERLRIARELHDDTTQELVTLSRQLDTLSDGSEQLPAQAIKRLDELQDRIDGIIKSVRRFSQDLRPSVLDDLGLVAALESIADDVTERYGIATEVKVSGNQQRLPPEKELLLFRIAQEALRNVWRHSRASTAFISVDFGHNKIKITVQDNGQGFQLPARLGDLASAGKLGLAGMYERAQLLDGSLELQSAPGKGTTLTIEVPLLS